MKKYLALLLVFIISISLMSCSTDSTLQENIPVRHPNVNASTVTTPSGTISIEDGKITLDGKVFEYGDVVVDDNSTISLIDDVLYIGGVDGLMRYNLTLQVKEPLYYDTMTYSIAGLKSVFYIADGFVYRLQSKNSYTILSTSSVPYGEVREHTFYYTQGPDIFSVDLLTEEIIQLATLQEPATSLKIEGNILRVYGSTVQKEIEL